MQSLTLRMRKTLPVTVFRVYLRFSCSAPDPVQRRIALLLEGLTGMPMSAKVIVRKYAEKVRCGLFTNLSGKRITNEMEKNQPKEGRNSASLTYPLGHMDHTIHSIMIDVVVRLLVPAHNYVYERGLRVLRFLKQSKAPARSRVTCAPPTNVRTVVPANQSCRVQCWA